MAETARVEPVGPGRYRLSGELGFATVPALADGPGLEPHEGRVELDLAGLERVDSAGLALLLDWWRTLQRQGAALILRGAPEQLRSLAAVAGLEGLLPFEGGPGGHAGAGGQGPLREVS